MKVLAEDTRAIMLDWDGTLVHSLDLKIQNAAELFEERFGLDQESVTTSYRTHSGISRRRLFNAIMADHGKDPLEQDAFDAMSASFTERNIEAVLKRGTLRDGVLDTLAKLREKGMVMAVSTAAAQEEMEPLAKELGVAEHCLYLLGSSPGFSKGPDHVEFVMETHCLAKRVMAMVGDDLQDLQLAKDAGVTPIGITGTRTREELTEGGAETVIDAIPELLRDA